MLWLGIHHSDPALLDLSCQSWFYWPHLGTWAKEKVQQHDKHHWEIYCHRSSSFGFTNTEGRISKQHQNHHISCHHWWQKQCQIWKCKCSEVFQYIPLVATLPVVDTSLDKLLLAIGWVLWDSVFGAFHKQRLLGFYDYLHEGLVHNFIVLWFFPQSCSAFMNSLKAGRQSGSLQGSSDCGSLHWVKKYYSHSWHWSQRRATCWDYMFVILSELVPLFVSKHDLISVDSFGRCFLWRVTI